MNTVALSSIGALSNEAVYSRSVDIDSSPQILVKGKFFEQDGKTLYIRGVTYGTFDYNEHGEQYPDPKQVHRDFSLMAKHGINSVRVIRCHRNGCLIPHWSSVLL